MSDFEDLLGEMDRGAMGHNSGIPMGFHRLNRYIGIRKKISTVIFGATGSGKSAFVHNAYILNPFDHYMAQKETVKYGLKVILFSQERSKMYTIAKWLSRKVFLTDGVKIPIQKMLGWWDTKLTKDEHDLILKYHDYMDELMNVVDIIEGPQNPTGIYKYLKAYAEANGKTERISEYKSMYTAAHPNEVVIPIIDHGGLMKLEGKMTFRKEAIDKTAEYLQMARDFWGYSPVWISQLTRGLNNPMLQKMDSIEPSIDDIKESGNPGEAADIVISLFDPRRFKTTDPSYNVNLFVDKNNGANYFRKVKILKNTYGEDNIPIGMAFQGFTGQFKELPTKKDMEGFDYNRLFTGEYFLDK